MPSPREKWSRNGAKGPTGMQVGGKDEGMLLTYSTDYAFFDSNRLSLRLRLLWLLRAVCLRLPVSSAHYLILPMDPLLFSRPL